jgi:hypothetical protein
MTVRSISTSARVRGWSSGEKISRKTRSSRLTTAMVPWFGEGTNRRGDSRVPGTDNPILSSPASASTMASYSPAWNFLRRVSTFPRSCFTIIPSICLSNWAFLRVLVVPTTVISSTGMVWARKSAGESLLRIAQVQRPGGRFAGISFME